MTFDELDEQQTKAALYVLELADIEPTRDNARLYLAWDVLTFTEDAQGRYCWNMDDEGNESALLLGKHSKIQIRFRYRFYFKKTQRLTLGSEYFDSDLSSDCFLGYEELGELGNPPESPEKAD